MRRALAILFLFAAAPALGFHAYPKGGPHDRATRRAADATEMDNSSLTALKQAVRRVDVEELAVDLRAAGNPGLMRGATSEILIHPRCDFEGSHHFQRGKTQTVDAVLRQGRGVLKKARIDALSALADGDRDRAVAALGLGLHVLQDFFAYSNVVFLDEHRQKLLLDWVLGKIELPDGHGVELVVYRPCNEEPPELPDDPAGSCAEDDRSALCASVSSRRSVAGARKDALGNKAFDRAVGFATDASIAWLQSIRREARDDWATVQ
ncbi:MAG: hypothetical protein EP330_22625 [Deltaproteobacteria bacterium]|nr:MAG: hypothetical protein EP330_22625 [Deltaproteobacteria bacterium]